MQPLVSVTGLTKTYRDIIALDDVALTVREGEVLGLIGPNGAGKTTLFECLAGVLPANTGRILIRGHEIATADRGRHLFYLPDAIAPWPSETVRWALDFTIGFFGGSSARKQDVVTRLGLEPLIHRPIGALSKGQRKRVALALGLLTPQPVLLADEPFEGLDLRQTRDVGAALREHAASGRTLFLSIHQISDAARVCDRFILLSGGRVRGEGTFDELALLAGRGRTAGRDTAGANAARTSADLEDVVLALT
jgi:ABC-2 type transport system ATP-binding protein